MFELFGPDASGFMTPLALMMLAGTSIAATALGFAPDANIDALVGAVLAGRDTPVRIQPMACAQFRNEILATVRLARFGAA